MKHTNTRLKIQGRVISGKQRPLPGTPRDSPEVFMIKLINYTINQKNMFPPEKSNLQQQQSEWRRGEMFCKILPANLTRRAKCFVKYSRRAWGEGGTILIVFQINLKAKSEKGKCFCVVGSIKADMRSKTKGETQARRLMALKGRRI